MVRGWWSTINTFFERTLGCDFGQKVQWYLKFLNSHIWHGRLRYLKNGWYEENDYIAFASASFRKKNTFRGLPRLQSGTIFHVLWHNPAYHYVENKWRCSSVVWASPVELLFWLLQATKLEGPGADHFVRKKWKIRTNSEFMTCFFFDIGASRLEDSTANHQQIII